jgi:hypothetical protein
MQSTLHEGDILTPESNKLLNSPSKRDFAGLSPDCEFLVMSENSLKDNDSVWTSDTFMPCGGCFATLNGPHLVVGLGPPSQPRNIVWYSDVHASGDNQEETHSMPPTFTAQLDDDGSLVVCQMVTLPSPCQTPTTGATKAHMVTRQFVVGTLLGHSFPSPTLIFLQNLSLHNRSMGCNRRGRRVSQLASDMSYLVKHMLAKLDHLFDAWMELVLLEEEDIVGTVIEGLHRGTEHCKQHGTILAHTGVRVARDMF